MDDTVNKPAKLGDAPMAFRYSPAMLPDVMVALDVVAILLSGIACHLFYLKFSIHTIEYYVFCMGFITLGAVLMLRRSGMYEISAIMRPVGRSDLVIVSIVAAFLFFLTMAFSLKVSDIYSRVWIYSFAATSILSVITLRVVAFKLLQRMSANQMIGRNLVVLGTGPQAMRLLERMERVNPFFITLRGVFSPSGDTVSTEFEGAPVLGDAEDLLAYARTNEVDDIVIAMPWNADEQLIKTVEALKELPVNVYVSTDLIGYQLAFRPVFGQFAELPLFEVVRRPISGWSFVLKVIEDYVLATLILVLLAPLFLAIAVAIKLDSKGPVFFKQRRLGFNNREFKIYKFRSMHHREAPEPYAHQATRSDPRVTRVGRFLRRTSLDELPQLFNVLNGTMSLVGPRPHAIEHNVDYGRQIRGYFARHKVKPGITGWAQVNGLRGETDALAKMEARVSYDIYYAENWSLLFDLRILVMTFFVVLFQKSAY